MKLSVVILTLNKLEYTKKFIASLYKYTKDFELIIVDNGSTDGTVEYLKNLSDIKLVLNAENKGFSAGNNKGIKLAEGEYIAFLNNDILLSPGWFEECEKVFERENAAFVSPVQINSQFDKANEHNYLSYFKSKNGYRKSFDMCEFACAVTKREVLDKIGVFDENYFPAFFEDNDLKSRAIEAGFGLYSVKSACFFHFGSITSKEFDYNLIKNRKYYNEKFPFGEYLTASAEEKEELRRIVEEFNKFPLNYIYAIYVFFRKAINLIKKGFKK